MKKDYYDKLNNYIWNKEYQEEINSKIENQKMEKLNRLREERNIIANLQKNIDLEKSLSKVNLLNKKQNYMREYMEFIENQKQEEQRKKELRQKQEITTLDVKNEEKIMQFKNYLLKLNSNVGKNQKIFADYMDYAKRNGANLLQNNLQPPSSSAYGYPNYYEQMQNPNEQYQYNNEIQQVYNNNQFSNYDNNNTYNNPNYQANFQTFDIPSQMNRNKVLSEEMNSKDNPLTNNQYNKYNQYDNLDRRQYKPTPTVLGLKNSNSMPNISKTCNFPSSGEKNIGQYEFTHFDKRTDITDNSINYRQNNQEYYTYKNAYKNYGDYNRQEIEKNFNVNKRIKIEEREKLKEERHIESEKNNKDNNLLYQKKIEMQRDYKKYLDSQIIDKNLKMKEEKFPKEKEKTASPYLTIEDQMIIKNNPDVLVKAYTTKKPDLGNSILPHNVLINPIPNYQNNKYIFRNMKINSHSQIVNNDFQSQNNFNSYKNKYETASSNNTLKLVGNNIIN